jgi:hypothetical protein
MCSKTPRFASLHALRQIIAAAATSTSIFQLYPQSTNVVLLLLLLLLLLVQLFEARGTFSNPATPISGSPPTHPATPPNQILRDAAGSTASTAASSLMFRPSSSRLSSEPQQQQQQLLQQQLQQQLQLHPSGHLQAAQLVRRNSADNGFLTYTIASLGHAHGSGGSGNYGQPGSSSGSGSQVFSSMNVNLNIGQQLLAAKRRASDQGEGSTHRRYAYFQAVREGLAEGESSTSGGGGTSGGTDGSTSAAAAAAAAAGGNGLQEPLLGPEERYDL